MPSDVDKLILLSKGVVLVYGNQGVAKTIELDEAAVVELMIFVAIQSKNRFQWTLFSR